MAEASLTPHILPTLKPEAVEVLDRVGDVAVYQAGSDVCLLTDTGLPFFLTNKQDFTNASISPDGELAVFTVEQRSEEINTISGDMTFYEEIWVLPTSGGTPRLIATTEQFHIDYPHTLVIISHLKWIPDSHKLVFSHANEQPRSLAYGDIQTLDADTAEAHLLVPPLSYAQLETEWGGPIYPSPNGSYIAYVTTDSINVVSTDGETFWREILIYDLITTYSDYTILPIPVWSADSAGFWVAIPPTNYETRMEMYYVSLAGEIRGIGSIRFDPADEFELRGPLVDYAVMSPNGTYVAYTQALRDTGLFIASTDGSQNNLYAEVNTQYTTYVFDQWIDDSHFIFTQVTWGSSGTDPITFVDYLAEVGGSFTVIEDSPLPFFRCSP